MSEFLPHQIETLIFDLNSLASSFNSEKWNSFIEIIRVLSERDYQIILISKKELLAELTKFEKASYLYEDTLQILNKNPKLIGKTQFWLTDDRDIQELLQKKQQLFASKTGDAKKFNGEQYSKIEDILHVFNPSELTSSNLVNHIVELKKEKPNEPLIIGVGGPEACGHPFFIDPLINQLEMNNLLVNGLDLTEVMGTEFFTNSGENHYWRSTDIRNWVVNEVLEPFSNDERVCIERSPSFLSEYETGVYPFFLAPEMILIVWGSTLFLPELSYFDLNILLTLSSKSSAARAFGIDETTDFDPKFIEDYEQNDGYYYQQYLEKNSVLEDIQFEVQFDNFHAFRLKNINL